MVRCTWSSYPIGWSEGRRPGGVQPREPAFSLWDTLALIDLRGLGQLFTISGKYVRSEPRLRPSGDRLGYFADGDRLVSVLQTDHITAERWQQTREALTRRGASSTVPLGEFPSVEAIRHGADFDGRIYAARHRAAVLPHAFCAGYNGTFQFACFDEMGKKLSIIQRASVPLRLVSNEDKEAYFAGILQANKTAPAIDEYMNQARATVQFSENFPAFGRLLASQDDLIWVDAGANYVAGVTKDADDNDVILVYPLRK